MKLPISQIKPNPDNPRQIKDDKFKKLVQSLKDFPEMAEVREVVVNKEHMILGGNMRYKAMLEAGWKEIPVRVVDWSPEKQREFIIKDNLAMGEMDWDEIANSWTDLPLDDWGLDLPAGFGDEEVVEDEAPEVSSEPPVSQLGSIYQLGRHRLMCGDSTDFGQVSDLLDGAEIDLLLTDPPYGMDLDADYSQLTSKNSFASGKKHQDVIGDDKQFDARFLMDMSKEVVLFGADYYVDTLPNFGKDGSWMVWDKRSSESQDKGFGSNFETIWSKVKHKRWILRHEWFGFFTGGEKREYEHPTTKPVKLLADILNKVKAGDIILDLFGGSGSTLIACEQLDRTCYMMELDPKYCDVIRKRYWKFVNEGNEEGWEAGTPVIKHELAAK